MTNLLNQLATLENIKTYTNFDDQTCQNILDYANEFEIADVKTAVEEFLDQD